MHGSWTTSFVHEPHRYLLPTLPEGGPLGRGRCGRPWPGTDIPAIYGELPRAAAMINEPVRRGRITGTDPLTPLSGAAPIDVFGIGTEDLHRHVDGDVVGCGDLLTAQLHDEVARRRVYVHTAHWTSLGLSLIEAMHMGMPVVAVAATEAPAAVPRTAGVVSADPEVPAAAIRRFVHEPEVAAICGKAARDAAGATYGLDRFHGDWNRLPADVTGKGSP
ncbi:glycosyltransferase [Rhodococcus chondri]|uniref:Glycosyltransferase n=1 Tax=Rhodococcus chondri TaxID=3065941 RepID=A0ABU7JT25_9NOCA|nr:glycosyltransferase [Rhodococcus sp. CC-R104]MEE2033069.1 glycosyltransferase [Rhodococcus sp. CC-R104]